MVLVIRLLDFGELSVLVCNCVGLNLCSGDLWVGFEVGIGLFWALQGDVLEYGLFWWDFLGALKGDRDEIGLNHY